MKKYPPAESLPGHFRMIPSLGMLTLGDRLKHTIKEEFFMFSSNFH